MNCLDVLDRLGALASGTCPPAEREAAERHAASCSSCADLLRDARRASAGFGGPESLDEEDADGFVEAVLGRTTGSACQRAEELLAEMMDASRDARDAFSGLEGPDEQLLAAHVAHCEACAALAESLAVASRLLPTFASVDPGPGFSATVFAATSRAIPVPPTLAGRTLAAWHRWQARPRFAFELAYIGTLLLVLIVGNPVMPLQASARSVAVAMGGIERARDGWAAAVPRLEVPASVRALSSVTSEMVDRKSALGLLIDAVWQRASVLWSSTWNWLRGTAWGVFSDLKRLWSGIWSGERSTPSASPGSEPGGASPR